MLIRYIGGERQYLGTAILVTSYQKENSLTSAHVGQFDLGIPGVRCEWCQWLGDAKVQRSPWVGLAVQPLHWRRGGPGFHALFLSQHVLWLRVDIIKEGEEDVSWLEIPMGDVVLVKKVESL